MNFESVIQRIGGQLHRQTRHKIYILPNGKQLVTPNTPGDWRHEREALANLSRLMGVSKRELLTPSIRHRVRPLRPLVLERPAEIAPAATAPSPAPSPTPPATAMSRAEAQLWKRLQKHDEQRQAKQSEQLKYLQLLAHRVHGYYIDYLDKGGVDMNQMFLELTCGVFVHLQSRFRPELMIAECIQGDGKEFNTLFVRTNNWFLDFAGNEIHQTPRWVSNLGEPGGAIFSIEVFGAIDVKVKDGVLLFKTGQL